MIVYFLDYKFILIIFLLIVEESIYINNLSIIKVSN